MLGANSALSLAPYVREPVAHRLYPQVRARRVQGLDWCRKMLHSPAAGVTRSSAGCWVVCCLADCCGFREGAALRGSVAIVEHRPRPCTSFAADARSGSLSKRLYRCTSQFAFNKTISQHPPTLSHVCLACTSWLTFNCSS